MKKNFLLVIILLTFLMPCIVKASSEQLGRVTGVSVRVRDKASINNGIILDKLYSPKIIEILSTTTDSSEGDKEGCSKNWFKISYSNEENKTITGYICSEYVKIMPDVTTEFDPLTFPESYRSALTSLHEKYPTWIFVPINTNQDFEKSSYEFSRNDKSLIYYTFDVGYRSISTTSYNYKKDEFYYHPQEGRRWYYASQDTVKYYLDPRNFLNEENIFMFESLEYNANVHNKNSVEQILGNTFMTASTLLEDGLTYKEKYNGYATWFMNAAEKYSVNPIHLAARVRQEVGANGSIATSGATFTYTYKENGQDKIFKSKGLYNLFSIGAYGYSPPAIAGLVYANGGVYGTNTKYERPWTSPEKAILGGAAVIDNGYVSKGQNTIYFERFNVNPKTQNTLFAHSYMTNISAPVQEARTSYDAYKNAGLLDEILIFEIPIYNNMPTNNVSLPNKGNPNNYLKEITVNGKPIDNFDGDNTTYEYILTKNNKITLNATPVNSNATIDGIGEITLTDIETDIELTVTAQNKAVRKYRVKFIIDDTLPMPIDEIMNNIGVKYDDKYVKDISIGILSDNIINNIKKVSLQANAYIKDAKGTIKTNTSLVTGDILAISSGTSYKEYTIIVTGDNNKDGEITIVDLLRIQKKLLKYSNLTEEELLASDVDEDGEITIVDLLRIQKYLLGYIDKLWKEWPIWKKYLNTHLV